MVYGSVFEALEGVEFPISKSDLLSKVGGREVRVSRVKALRMANLLGPCEQEIFNSAKEVVECPSVTHKLTGYEGVA